MAAKGGGPKKGPGRPPNKSSKPGTNRPNDKPKDKPAHAPGTAYTYSDTTTPISGYRTPFKNDAANRGKAYLIQSYGKYGTEGNLRSDENGSMKAVMDYYHSLPKAQRMKAYAAITNAVENRDFSTWSGQFYSVLMGDLDMGARVAYASKDPRRNGTQPASEFGDLGDIGVDAGTGQPGSGESWTTGVSGLTGEFIKELGVQGPAGLASEADAAGPTKDKRKRRKAQKKKLVKRAVKKTDVSGKTIRKALRSPGVTKSDKKVYAKVAKQSTPKLSARLRLADRRGSKK